MAEDNFANLADDICLMLGEDGRLTMVIEPDKLDYQRMWLDEVRERAPVATGLATRLVHQLLIGSTNVIRLNDAVRRALDDSSMEADRQLLALTRAELVAVHVRHILPSEVVLTLSEKPPRR
jgi:hypothetical protein